MQLNSIQNNQNVVKSIPNNTFVNNNNVMENNNIYFDDRIIKQDVKQGNFDCIQNEYNVILNRETGNNILINIQLTFTNFKSLNPINITLLYGDRYLTKEVIKESLQFQTEYDGIVKVFTSRPNISITGVISELISFIQSEYGYKGYYYSGNYYRGVIQKLPDGFNIKSLNRVLFFYNGTSCYTGIKNGINHTFTIDFNNNIINDNYFLYKGFDQLILYSSENISCNYCYNYINNV